MSMHFVHVHTTYIRIQCPFGRACVCNYVDAKEVAGNKSVHLAGQRAGGD